MRPRREPNTLGTTPTPTELRSLSSPRAALLRRKWLASSKPATAKIKKGRLHVRERTRPHPPTLLHVHLGRGAAIPVDLCARSAVIPAVPMRDSVVCAMALERGEAVWYLVLSMRQWRSWRARHRTSGGDGVPPGALRSWPRASHMAGAILAMPGHAHSLSHDTL